MNMQSASIPRPALILGLGGLLPFFVTAIAALVLDNADPSSTTTSESAVKALGAYGAVILSFLGGVRWGKLLDEPDQLRQWLPLTLSVAPSLIAWPALLLPDTPMLMLLMAGFVIQYALDRAAVRHNHLPVWFGRLRLMLTCGAVASLALAFVSV